MTSPRTIRTAILLLAGSAALAACASKAPKQLPPDPGANVSTNTAQEPVQGTGITPGSQADFAARMMGLARPGQILLSETAFGLAQRARHELGSSGERLWDMGDPSTAARRMTMAGQGACGAALAAYPSRNFCFHARNWS